LCTWNKTFLKSWNYPYETLAIHVVATGITGAVAGIVLAAGGASQCTSCNDCGCVIGKDSKGKGKKNV